jgi:hypothetical protein
VQRVVDGAAGLVNVAEGAVLQTVIPPVIFALVDVVVGAV